MKYPILFLSITLNTNLLKDHLSKIFTSFLLNRPQKGLSNFFRQGSITENDFNINLVFYDSPLSLLIFHAIISRSFIIDADNRRELKTRTAHLGIFSRHECSWCEARASEMEISYELRYGLS